MMKKLLLITAVTIAFSFQTALASDCQQTLRDFIEFLSNKVVKQAVVIQEHININQNPQGSWEGYRHSCIAIVNPYSGATDFFKTGNANPEI